MNRLQDAVLEGIRARDVARWLDQDSLAELAGQLLFVQPPRRN